MDKFEKYILNLIDEERARYVIQGENIFVTDGIVMKKYKLNTFKFSLTVMEEKPEVEKFIPSEENTNYCNGMVKRLERRPSDSNSNLKVVIESDKGCMVYAKQKYFDLIGPYTKIMVGTGLMPIQIYRFNEFIGLIMPCREDCR